MNTHPDWLIFFREVQTTNQLSLLDFEKFHEIPSDLLTASSLQTRVWGRAGGCGWYSSEKMCVYFVSCCWSSIEWQKKLFFCWPLILSVLKNICNYVYNIYIYIFRHGSYSSIPSIDFIEIPKLALVIVWDPGDPTSGCLLHCWEVGHQSHCAEAL